MTDLGLAPVPEAAAAVFGDRLPLAIRFAEWLADAGTVRGLIGPREVPRVWDRHLLNCAVVTEAIPAEASIVDLGSGAGLPGVVLALVRPDVTVTLVEPLERRTTFLSEVVEALALNNVEVVRGRAEDLHPSKKSPGRQFDVVTSRALAPLDRLLRWSWPLVGPGGMVLAMKGSRAAAEIESARHELRRRRCAAPEVIEVGTGVVSPPTTLVRIARVSASG